MIIISHFDMNKKTLTRVAWAAAIALTLTSCGQKRAQITGNITEAKDSVLYLDNMSLDGPKAIDSVRLGDDGAFTMKALPANGGPEFYRLRINGRIINLSVDSTETITVRAKYPTMATDYEVEGSQNCLTIRELALKQMDLQRRLIDIQGDINLSPTAAQDSIVRCIEAYKQDVKMNYIYKEPMKASSYFALFQTLGNMLIFNPRENAEDIKAFAAVATSWDTYYPEAVRGQNLHNIAIEGMKDLRIARQQDEMVVDASKVNVTNIIDIALPDNHGQTRRLTDLKGKVVIIDFHVFAAKESPARIMKLRDIYNKYHAQGLEIFQVSFDPDMHFWKQQTEALPWICVHDNRLTESPIFSQYNLQGLPTFFLMDRENVLHKRDAQIKDLDAEIRSLL